MFDHEIAEKLRLKFRNSLSWFHYFGADFEIFKYVRKSRFFLNETEQNLILAKFGWSRVSQNCSHFLTSRYVTKILTYTYLRIPKDSHVTTLGIWL